MASNSGSQYGNYNPAAVDPYPIESALVPEAVKGNPRANTMLDLYQLQRQANSNIYGAELDKQHDFNRQQLAQQLHEANMKTAADLGKSPGAAGLFANAPEYQGVFGGASPDAIRQMVDTATRAQTATDFEHAAAGGLSASSAGMPVDPQAFTNLTHMPVIPGQRPDIQIAQMNNAAHLAAASMHANADKNYVTVPGPPGADGLPTSSRVRIDPNDREGAARIIRERRELLRYAGTDAIPGMTPPSDGGATAAPAVPAASTTPASQTNLTPAPQTKGKSGLMDWRSPEGTQAQQVGRQHIHKLPTEARKDVDANTPAAGILPLTRQGNIVVYVGKSGRTYSVAP